MNSDKGESKIGQFMLSKSVKGKNVSEIDLVNTNSAYVIAI